jgi:hypothetical protein
MGLCDPRFAEVEEGDPKSTHIFGMKIWNAEEQIRRINFNRIYK